MCVAQTSEGEYRHCADKDEPQLGLFDVKSHEVKGRRRNQKDKQRRVGVNGKQLPDNTEQYRRNNDCGRHDRQKYARLYFAVIKYRQYAHYRRRQDRHIIEDMK